MNVMERSDLACEIAGNGKTLCKGAEWRTREAAGFAISELIISTKEAADTLEKPCGQYLTIECGRIDLLSAGDHRALSHLLAEQESVCFRSPTPAYYHKGGYPF